MSINVYEGMMNCSEEVLQCLASNSFFSVHTRRSEIPQKDFAFKLKKEIMDGWINT